MILLPLPGSLSEQISHGAHQLTPFFECLLLLYAQSVKGHVGNTHVLKCSKLEEKSVMQEYNHQVL